ncbi:hypothetical protein A0U93_01810 [Neoasaia chiangmaiensis]|uniref:Uncharacterized protein n=1 Tax=Neoasaia chiangmaiensis TaxID=320497 RepID=A0A1U9KM73_9PROT|nr:hypothetical protein A0U93_01810 [Neoasaia chiangmaiensis]
MSSILSDLWSEAHQKGVQAGMERVIQLTGGLTSPATQPKPNPSPARPNESDEPWTGHIKSFFRDNPGISEKTRESYNITFKQACDLITNKPIRAC